MKKKLINSQLSNYATYQMNLRQMLTLAENVYIIENLPFYIDKSFLNKTLLHKGNIAFFEDEILGLLALPFTNIGNLDVYNRPINIQVYGQNGYNRVIKGQDNFVIMYDNLGRYPLYIDICQYAERLALNRRTCDINISQQKTPRYWKTTTENVKSLQDLINNIDGCTDTVLAYDDLDLTETQLILEPAPFISDKIEDYNMKIWNEFLRLIGIANMNFQKKERNIKDEIMVSQGGTIASRYNRYTPRVDAIELINKRFAHLLEKPLEVSYYDNLPTTLENNLEEGEENDL